MRKPRSYKWYLAPEDHEANRVIAENLQNPEDAMESVMCHDGVKRNLWLCSASFANQMKKLRSDINLKFKIYVSEGNTKPRIFVGETLKSRVRTALMNPSKKKELIKRLQGKL